MYRLKKGQEAFQVVDGPFAKRRYRQGVEYADADVPPREKHRFGKAESSKLKAEGKKNENKKKLMADS